MKKILLVIAIGLVLGITVDIFQKQKNPVENYEPVEKSGNDSFFSESEQVIESSDDSEDNENDDEIQNQITSTETSEETEYEPIANTGQTIPKEVVDKNVSSPKQEQKDEIDTEEKISDAEYTEDGRFIKNIVNSQMNKTDYEFDTTSGLIKSITNANDKKTNYNYDENKRLESITMGEKNINYTYNDKNMITKITEKDKTYNFEYDEFSNIKTAKIGNSINLITNSYKENNGNLQTVTYGNGQAINLTYNEFDRISVVEKMDNVYNYRYDNRGNLAKIIDNHNTAKYSYDFANRLYKYSYDNFGIEYKYDDNNNVSNILYNLNDIEQSVQNTIDDYEINYQYDGLGRLNNKNINNLFNTNYNYITNGKRTTILVKEIDNNGDNYTYNYDKLDNITHIYHNGNLINRYYYDDYNQLIFEKNYVTNESIDYHYDVYGNMTSKKTYNLLTNELINEDTFEYNNLNWQDQLTKINNEIISYDGAGNPVSIGSKTLTWINGRKLSRYEDGTNTINYKYDTNGIRISKTINNIETKYYLESSKIVIEKTGDNVLYFMRDDTDELVGFKYNDSIYYYLKNAQDDVIGILDSNYSLVARYSYDSWGNILSIVDSAGNDISSNASHIANINPYRYRSYYYDKETKLYYLNSRYYNPKWYRFINADIILGANSDMLSYNLYIYGSNNPITYVDPSGGGVFSWIKKKVKKAAKKIGEAIYKMAEVAADFIGKVICVEVNHSTSTSEKYGNDFVGSVETGVETTASKSYIGNNNSLVKFKINWDDENIFRSTVGLEKSVGALSISKEYGLGHSSVEGGWTNKIGSSVSFEIGLDLINVYSSLNTSSSSTDSHGITATTTTFSQFKIGPAIPVAIIGGYYISAVLGGLSIPAYVKTGLTALFA